MTGRVQRTRGAGRSTGGGRTSGGRTTGGRSSGGRTGGGQPPSYASSRNVPFGTPPSSSSQIPSTSQHPSTSGTVFADQFMFVPRVGQTGFQEQPPVHHPPVHHPPAHQPPDLAGFDAAFFPDGHVAGGINLDEFDFVAETEEGPGAAGDDEEGQQQEEDYAAPNQFVPAPGQAAVPSPALRALLETEGRADSCIVLHPGPNAPPHSHW